MRAIYKLLIILLLIQVCSAGGNLWLKLNSFKNPNSKRNSGDCCDTSCSNPCETYLKICVSHANDQQPCSILNVTTAVLGGNDFNFGNDLGNGVTNPLFISFNERKSNDGFQLLIEAWDYDNGTMSDLIDKFNMPKIPVRPASSLQRSQLYNFQFSGSVSVITLSLRVYCQNTFLLPSCYKQCLPTNTSAGHYSCDYNLGKKICLPNWYGTNCTLSKCVPRNDNIGHYTCDLSTGNKICLQGWKGLNCTEQIKEYIFSDIKTDWYNAREECREKDADLVTIETANENSKLNALIRSNGSTVSYWIGLNDIIDENSFMWISSYSSLPSFRDWSPGEPNSQGDEDCVEMKKMLNWKWNDEPCNATNGYICEKPLPPGHDFYCTPTHRCELGEGDCDVANDCKPGLVCGTDNCKGSQYDSTDDCCKRDSTSTVEPPPLNATTVMIGHYIHTTRKLHETQSASLTQHVLTKLLNTDGSTTKITMDNYTTVEISHGDKHSVSSIIFKEISQHHKLISSYSKNSRFLSQIDRFTVSSTKMQQLTTLHYVNSTVSTENPQTKQLISSHMNKTLHFISQGDTLSVSLAAPKGSSQTQQWISSHNTTLNFPSQGYKILVSSTISTEISQNEHQLSSYITGLFASANNESFKTETMHITSSTLKFTSSITLEKGIDISIILFIAIPLVIFISVVIFLCLIIRQCRQRRKSSKVQEMFVLSAKSLESNGCQLAENEMNKSKPDQTIILGHIHHAPLLVQTKFGKHHSWVI